MAREQPTDGTPRIESKYCYGCERYVDSVAGTHPEIGPTEFCPHCGETSIFNSEADYYRNRIKLVRESFGHEVLKAASGDGHHWIRYDQDSEEFRAVYAGPHDPENAEATIDHANIMTLLRAADSFHVEQTARSPFTDPDVCADGGRDTYDTGTTHNSGDTNDM